MSLLHFTEYWTAIGTGLPFFGMSLERCLKAIHKDIVTIWNIRDLHDVCTRVYHNCVFAFIASPEYFLSDAFHRRMMVIVEDLKDASTE